MKKGIRFTVVFFLAILLFSGCSQLMQSSDSVEQNDKNSVYVHFSQTHSENFGDHNIEAHYRDCSANLYIYEGEFQKPAQIGIVAELPHCRESELLASEIVKIQQEQLKHLFEKWDVEEISYVRWPNPMYDEDHSWLFPIALASAESGEYADYRANYPNAQNNHIHAIFGNLARQTDAYKYTNDLFREFGAELQLGPMEKMGASLVSEIPFDELRNQLIEAGLSGDERVITGPVQYSFELKRL